MLRLWSMSRTAPSTIAPASPWRLPTEAETPPMLDTPPTPWITSTSPACARLCASISPRPEVLRSEVSLFWLSTVIACPTSRALASVARKIEPGTTPLMRHSSIASDVVPVRSPSARKPCRICGSSRGSSSMPKARGSSRPSGVLAIQCARIMSEPKPSYHDNPTEPKLKLPSGSCDCHFHVFGPKAKFPFAEKAAYLPADAPKEVLIDRHMFLGIDRGVVVQSAAHGFDNSAAADLLADMKGKYV